MVNHREYWGGMCKSVKDSVFSRSGYRSIKDAVFSKKGMKKAIIGGSLVGAIATAGVFGERYYEEKSPETAKGYRNLGNLLLDYIAKRDE